MLTTISFTLYLSLLATASSSPVPPTLETIIRKNLMKAGSSTTNAGVLPIDIAITRRIGANVTTQERLVNLQASFARTLEKYNITESIASTIDKRAEPVGFVQMGDAPNDIEYFATIYLGTPPVAFEVALDTGSADLVIITAPCKVGCDDTTVVYRPTDSSTSVVTSTLYQINYQVGGGTGLVVTDTITFGGYTLAHQAFGALTSSTTVAGPGGINAVFGLARQTLSLLGQVPFVQALYLDGLLPDSQFGFAPARWGLTSDTVQPGGVLTLGGINSTLISGPITYMPVTSQFYWEIAVQDITVKGKSLGIASRQVSIDTGTTNIYVPLSAATAIYTAIPGSSAVGGGLYTFPCTSKINLAWNFGGVSFSMLDADFNIGMATADGYLCFGAVSSLNTNQFIIGDAFLKNVYSAFQFSPPSVGFAQLANPQQLKNGYVPSGSGITVGGGGNIVVGPGAAAAASASAAAAAAAAALATPSAAVLKPVATLSATAAVPQNSAPTKITPAVPNIADIAARIQAAIVDDIANASRNAVTQLTCPNGVVKVAEVWSCQ